LVLALQASSQGWPTLPVQLQAMQADATDDQRKLAPKKNI
jgi:hypothetical protein